MVCFQIAWVGDTDLIIEDKLFCTKPTNMEYFTFNEAGIIGGFNGCEDVTIIIYSDLFASEIRWQIDDGYLCSQVMSDVTQNLWSVL